MRGITILFILSMICLISARPSRRVSLDEAQEFQEKKDDSYIDTFKITKIKDKKNKIELSEEELEAYNKALQDYVDNPNDFDWENNWNQSG